MTDPTDKPDPGSIDDPDWIRGVVAEAILRASDDVEPAAAVEPSIAADPAAVVDPVRAADPLDRLPRNRTMGSSMSSEHPSSATMPDLERALDAERRRPVNLDAPVMSGAPRSERVRANGLPPDDLMEEEAATTEGFRSSDIRTVLEWLAVIVSALVVALVIKAFVLQAFWIPSVSMETTVNKGDRILVNKVSYRLHDVRRGDLVVFKKVPGTPGDTEDLIKRAIALPGETIEVRSDGRIWIWAAGETAADALLLDEPYLDPQNQALPAPSATDALSADIWDEACVNQPRTPGRCTLAVDQLFMMGDNRTQSSDSRFFGPITEDLVVGRAFLRIWPLGELSSL
ncbi:MAG: signal peptidase I [Acidimicrobiales bacterium]